MNNIEKLAAVSPVIPEGVDIPAFTPDDVAAISSLPLSMLKPIVTEAQFAALTKFVNINQMVTGFGHDEQNHG